MQECETDRLRLRLRLKFIQSSIVAKVTSNNYSGESRCGLHIWASVVFSVGQVARSGKAKFRLSYIYE